MAASSPREAKSISSDTNSNLTAPKMDRDESKAGDPQLKSSSGQLEQGFYSNMLNPMLDDLEKKVTETTNMLDKIQKDMEADRRERTRKRLSAHIPEALQGNGEDPQTVLQKVEQLIYFQEIEGTDEIALQDHVRLPNLDQVSKTALVANSLKAYLTTLEEPELKRVTNKITSDCQLWLSRLFRFDNSCVVYHNDERNGLVRICRLALHLRYPKYATDGFDALYSRPPVIYLSAAARPGLGHYLCLQLGLPLSCVCTVPCNTVFGASSKMDVAMLEKLIQDDIAAARTPVLLLAFAGTPIVGHVDNLQRLQEICKTNNIWLHVEGCYLATLTLFSVPTEVSSARSGDSLTINLSPWLGVPGLPSFTLFKASDATLMHAADLSTFNTTLKLDCLPVWTSLLCLGHQSIVNRITFACDLAKLLYDKLDQITTIKQISRHKKPPQKEYKSLMELLSKAISALLVFEMASPTVVFRYSEDSAGPGAVVAPYAVTAQTEESEQSTDDLYFDSLNIWLAENLQSSNPKVAIETVEVEREGVCIRYCPLESAQVKRTTKKDIEQFVESLTTSLSVLNASTMQRKRFRAIVETQPNLRLIHLDNWAGLGAVSYIPEVYLNQTRNPMDQITINNLNAELVHQLKAKDTAFSIGETDEGQICVKFGLITQETDVEELINLVQNTGREVEESSKFIESMSEMIRKGIEEANKELRKESEEKLMHEGVLRQVPLVSSLLNWFSPVKEDIKGRSFNLSSGKIVSTEETYKYHMQIKESEDSNRSLKSLKGGIENATHEMNGIENGNNSTTAGQVKAQLVSQASGPSSPVTSNLPAQGTSPNVLDSALASALPASPAS